MYAIQVDGIEYRFFDHLYAVSRCGKVLRKMKPYTPTNHSGYLSLGRQRLMHRVIAICWVPNPGFRKQVHHINGIKTDNRADNLEWVTPKEHMGDKHRGMTGRYVRSPETREKYRQARLGKKDSEDVRQIKAKILEANRIRRPFRFNDIDYPSVAAAARAAGMHLSVFRKKHLPENFPS